MNTAEVSNGLLNILEKFIQKYIREYGYDVKVRLVRNTFYYNNWVIYVSGDKIKDPQQLESYMLGKLNVFLNLIFFNDYYRVRSLRFKSVPRHLKC